ncbi:MAG: ABC transporter permease [Actinobacteria bacterium]|nr:ABC transporter permease [Actinomycetota bacterium]
MIFKNFSSYSNILGILYSIASNSIVAGAMTVLFVSGGFDISAGVMLGFAGVFIGRMIVGFSMPIPIAILLAVIIGAAIGTIMGYIISYLDISPFFVTLSAYFIIGSCLRIVSERQDIVGFPVNFGLIAQYKILGIPIMIIFAIINIIFFDVMMRKNVYFRQNFAVGSNEQAAIVSGIKVKRLKMFNYTLVSTMAAISGIILTSRYMAAYQSSGADAAFQIITAVIIGGASLKGGKGSVLGTFLGIVLMALVYNSFIFFKMNIAWNKFAIGLILILVVIFDVNIQKERTIKLKT